MTAQAFGIIEKKLVSLPKNYFTMKHLYFLSIALFSLNATAQLKDCATCATQVIKEQQISKLSIDELRFLTNDLYARKGYEISNYFNEKPWYKPVSDNSKVKLNAVEEQNVKLFQERTAILKADREKLIEALRSLKAEAQKGNSPIPKDNYNEHFSKTIAKIDIDDIHWIKNQGYYSAEIDDFKQRNRYFIWIEVTIQCDENGHSKKVSEDKIKEVYDTDEFEVMESNISWEFRWDKPKIDIYRVCNGRIKKKQRALFAQFNIYEYRRNQKENTNHLRGSSAKTIWWYIYEPRIGRSKSSPNRERESHHFPCGLSHFYHPNRQWLCGSRLRTAFP